MHLVTVVVGHATEVDRVLEHTKISVGKSARCKKSKQGLKCFSTSMRTGISAGAKMPVPNSLRRPSRCLHSWRVKSAMIVDCACVVLASVVLAFRFLLLWEVSVESNPPFAGRPRSCLPRTCSHAISACQCTAAQCKFAVGLGVTIVRGVASVWFIQTKPNSPPNLVREIERRAAKKMGSASRVFNKDHHTLKKVCYRAALAQLEGPSLFVIQSRMRRRRDRVVILRVL